MRTKICFFVDTKYRGMLSTQKNASSCKSNMLCICTTVSCMLTLGGSLCLVMIVAKTKCMKFKRKDKKKTGETMASKCEKRQDQE